MRARTAAPTDIFRPIEGRTERTVAAEVVARIVAAGVVSNTPRMLAELAHAAGAPLPLVQVEYEKLQQGRRAPFAARPVVDGGEPWTPPALTVVPEPPRAEPAAEPARVEPPTVKEPPRLKGTYQDGARRHNEALRAKKEPIEGERICCRCKKSKPKKQFNVKRKASGQLHSVCILCQKEYGAERYLSSKNLAKLGPVLTFILEANDAHAGQPCTSCSQPCIVGDEVVASDIVLHHVRCTQPAP